MAMAPANYSGLANLMNLQGVGVNPTSQLAYVPSKDLMTRYQTIPNPSTGIPQAMGVTGMAEGGMPSQQYPMQEEAMELANRGRYGDTTLVHMTPGEVQGLASLGQLTINPDTGLPEAFSMKSLLPIIGGIAGSFLLPGVGTALGASALGATAIGAGLGTAAGGLLAGQSLGEAALGGVMSGAMSFGIGSLMAAPGLKEGVTSTLSPDVINAGMADPFGEVLTTTAGKPLAGLSGLTQQTSAFEAFTPTISSDYIPPSAYEMAAYNQQPAMQALGGDFVNLDSGPFVPAYKGAGFPATAPSVTPPSFAEMATLEQAAALPTSSLTMTPDTITPNYSLEKAYEPNMLERTLLGRKATPAGPLTPEQFSNLGGVRSNLSTMELAKQKLTDPLTYAPAGVAALTGGFDDPYEYEEPAARPPVDTGFGDYRIVGGEERNPETAKEIQKRMLAGGVRPSYFSPTQRYVRNAAEGGIVGLQQGGMATPQAPSAMAGMLTQPQPQQPLPINVQVQPQQPVMPQQPQPSMPMPQTGSGVAPLPDQQKEFMKLMDMEDQLQSQKRSQSTQALASLIGLGTDFASNQYPQTSPSGQAVQPPPTPPMNYGSQVNLGATGGFAQGGMINRAEGGPTRGQFNDFMKNISNTPVGLFMRISGLDKQFESRLPVGGGGGGAESMNRLLSRDVYSNNAGSVVPASVQSPGGAESMNQLLSNPVYSKQAATGGFLGYNQGGMPSQSQPYFEGQVQGPGDGQSDEVAFRVNGGQIDGAMLSPDEYVLAADVVSAIGNGSSDAGAAKLDQFMKGVRQDAYGTTKQMQPFNNQGLTNLVA